MQEHDDLHWLICKNLAQLRGDRRRRRGRRREKKKRGEEQKEAKKGRLQATENTGGEGTGGKKEQEDAK